MYKQDSEGLGRYIAQVRESRCMSQNELADKCDISRTEISRIETGGRKQPSLNNLRKIAEVLCIPYRDLLALAKYIPEDESSALEFYYPGLKTQKQIETANYLLAFVEENPNMPDDAFDMLIKQAELLAVAHPTK